MKLKLQREIFFVKSNYKSFFRLAIVNLSNGSHGLMTPTLVAMQCKEEPTTVFNNNSTNISGGRPTILEHIEEHIKDNVPHVHRSTKKRRERKTPFSR